MKKLELSYRSDPRNSKFDLRSEIYQGHFEAQYVRLENDIMLRDLHDGSYTDGKTNYAELLLIDADDVGEITWVKSLGYVKI
jgi:hypothetical protein